MNGNQYYQPLTNDYYKSSNSTTNQNQTPIQVNLPTNSDGTLILYKSANNCGIVMMVICYIFVIIFGGSISYLMFSRGVWFVYAMIPLIFPLIGIAGLIFSTTRFSINYDKFFGAIIIKREKSLFCFNRKKKIQLNDISLIIIESYMSGEDNDIPYFRVKFKLKDGKEIKALSESNGNGEGRQAFLTIKNNLPENTPFGGNLAY